MCNLKFAICLCAICNLEFEEERDLNAHVSNVHDGKNPIKCDLCESTFARINGLNQGLLDLDGRNSQKYLHQT